ncbi:uncharacterized protein LOC133873431 [Alnus glutinosa]|uniref:uncharacterized protein LOC133873431 n=1 Tax=Alnus glutinosa TaxID=3517 RepID=UPI002D792AF2|nr:uncharacterized protein LOC133873431 [Alnus glutinosa]
MKLEKMKRKLEDEFGPEIVAPGRFEEDELSSASEGSSFDEEGESLDGNDGSASRCSSFSPHPSLLSSFSSLLFIFPSLVLHRSSPPHQSQESGNSYDSNLLRLFALTIKHGRGHVKFIRCSKSNCGKCYPKAKEYDLFLQTLMGEEFPAIKNLVGFLLGGP